MLKNAKPRFPLLERAVRSDIVFLDDNHFARVDLAQIRNMGVRLKLNVNRALIKGKRVILVDDSVVRVDMGVERVFCLMCQT